MANSAINPLLPVAPVGSVLKQKKRQKRSPQQHTEPNHPDSLNQSTDEQSSAGDDKPGHIDTYA